MKKTKIKNKKLNSHARVLVPTKQPVLSSPPVDEEAASDVAKMKQKTKGVEQLVALGKEKGFLTYDDINKTLPAHVTSSEEIEEVLMTLNTQQIDVTDSDQSVIKDGDA
jgi:hypothetical protein